MMTQSNDKQASSDSKLWQKQALRIAVTLIALIALTALLRMGASAHASAVAPGNPPPYIVAPVLLSDACPVPFLRLRINDAEPMYFLFDMGSTGGLDFMPWAADRLKLPGTGGSSYLGTKPVSVTRAAILSKTNGLEFVLKDFQAARLPNDLSDEAVKLYGVRIAGIIGADLAQRFLIRLDPDEKTLSLYPLETDFARVAGAVIVPLLPTIYGIKQERRDVLLRMPGAGEIRFLLDTGASTVYLPLAYAKRVTGLRVNPQTSFSVGVQGIRASYMGLVSTMQSGLVSEPNVIVSIVKKINFPLLGMSFLSRFRITLDYRRNRMVLERTADYSKRILVLGDSGIQKIGIKDAALRITRITADGPAYQAGIRGNERVLAINGKSAMGMTGPDATALMEGGVGTLVTLRLQRDINGTDGVPQQPFEVSFKRVDIFQPTETKYRYGVGWDANLASPEANDGLFKDLFAAEVDAGSGAMVAGLRTEDEVVSINGIAVTALSLDKFNALFDNLGPTSSITFVVRRKGSDKPLTLTVKASERSTLDLLP
ncbi:MAG: retroviral-like aspartic protease family protein [Bryobacteraceae bacterium]|nr:retroviral-like aspartic protease family protein [Bryobacteraceae bacterium]